MYDLSARLTPADAVAALEGLRFKSNERRLKRYAVNDRIAEAVLGGSLSVMTLAQQAALGNAILVGRRRLTLADFPWTTRMQSEGCIVQHTTCVTHRVALVCETGAQPEDASVRIEWDFSSVNRRRGAPKEDDHAERVDWVLQKLGVPSDGAELTLKRLLRIKQRDDQRRATESDPEEEPETDPDREPEEEPETGP